MVEDSPSPVRGRSLRSISRWRSRPVFWILLCGSIGVLLGAGLVGADVILSYHASTSLAGATNPFKFINGANYATANAQGYQTNTYPNAAQASITVAASAADGAASTYELDTIEVQTAAATTAAWTLEIDVSTALVGTGINAAWISYCTVAPTGIADTGASLANGVDANGNPWVIYPPTCTGTQVSESMTVVAKGATIPVATGTATGVSVMYISLLLAVTNTGAATTTAASLTLVATT